MRPWPKELLKSFPLPPSRDYGREHPRIVAERPWWATRDIVRSTGVVDHLKQVAERRDGAVIIQRDKSFLIAQGVSGVVASLSMTVPKKGSWQEVRAVLMKEIDRVAPLPHPGFRSGQVWSLEFPQLFVDGVLDSWIPDPRYLLFHNSMPTLLEAPWRFGGREISFDEFNHLFKGQPLVNLDPYAVPVATPPNTYLVADPACPWLAPWAPALPKE